MSYFIDPYTLPAGVGGFVQLLFLLAIYGYILFCASNMISDGSELLLLVPAVAGVVGSVVLPVLGAVPDGAIVLFSGLGDDAQEELSVGVGALAGSTIMLLTIPWFLSIVGGRVDIDKESKLAVYKRPHGAVGWTKLTPESSLFHILFKTGVTGSPLVKKGGWVMMITAISYFIIQGPAFYLSGETDAEISAGEQSFALAGMIMCTVLFFGYLTYQWYLSRSDSDELLEDFLQEIRREKITKGEISLLGLMQAEIALFSETQTVGEYQSMAGVSADPLVDASDQPISGGPRTDLPEKSHRRLKRLLKTFFDKYDSDSDKELNKNEFASVFRDLHEKLGSKELDTIFDENDTDGSGRIDFEEFLHGVTKFVLEKAPNGNSRDAEPAAGSEEAEESMEDNEEHEEIPKDLEHLDPRTQQFRIKIRSLWLMAVGTTLVLTFSDPIVDVMSAVGDRTGISSFYISFVLAPLASNASELIAAFNYSLKKTSRTIAISFATLQGAACLNNTFCLGVFMFLIYFRSLAWEFSAETVTILTVVNPLSTPLQAIMAAVSMKNTHRVIDGILVLSLYPLSLMMVAGLEALGWD
ncbi:unnamed protein product [Ascophyllum nodosum]